MRQIIVELSLVVDGTILILPIAIGHKFFQLSEIIISILFDD